MIVIDLKARERRIVARFKDAIFDLQPKSYCLVEIDGDMEIAKAKTTGYEWLEEIPPEGEYYVVRPATEEDFEIIRRNRAIERDAYVFCLNRIRARDLPMALGAVERAFDGRKLRFYFTAENRIDFRELVKDLAAQYKTRIEMRQVGVRDRARKIGGFGICGEELCCSRFLQKFEPITIRMAKEQNLALNPTKISGLCGRLMCCLSYEVDNYTKARKAMPPLGTVVKTAQGEGVIINFNYVRKMLTVQLEDNKILECSKDELTILGDRAPVKVELDEPYLDQELTFDEF